MKALYSRSSKNWWFECVRSIVCGLLLRTSAGHRWEWRQSCLHLWQSYAHQCKRRHFGREIRSGFSWRWSYHLCHRKLCSCRGQLMPARAYLEVKMRHPSRLICGFEWISAPTLPPQRHTKSQWSHLDQHRGAFCRGDWTIFGWYRSQRSVFVWFQARNLSLAWPCCLSPPSPTLGTSWYFPSGSMPPILCSAH